MAHRASWLLSWIVAFKVVKVALLATLGVLLLSYAHQDPVGVLITVAMAVHLPATSRLFIRALSLAMGLTVRREMALALTAFGYAALLGTEAVGLALRRAWARWFTIGVTGSLLPIEVYEIARRPEGPVRILTFLVNIAIVVYLYRRKEIFEAAPTHDT